MAKMASAINVPFGRRRSYDTAAFLCLLCRRYVRRGVLREEDGWVREEEDRTMRCKEVRRTRIRGRGGIATGADHSANQYTCGMA